VRPPPVPGAVHRFFGRAAHGSRVLHQRLQPRPPSHADLEQGPDHPGARAGFTVFPFLYAPTEIDGEHYIEGAALDTLNFTPFITDPETGVAPAGEVDTLVVLDILGEDRLIRKPRNLYDAWVRSIITPLVKISQTEQRLFELEHNRDPLTGAPLRQVLKVDLMAGVPQDHWPQVLDWSAQHAVAVPVGYRAGWISAASTASCSGRKRRTRRWLLERSWLAADPLLHPFFLFCS
jgi:hypothetical protein